MSAPLVSVAPVADARPMLPVRPGAERNNTDTYKAQPKAIKLPYSETALAQLQASASKQESNPSPGPAVAAATAPQAPQTSAVAAVPPLAVAPPPTSPALPPAVADASDDRIDWGWPARGKIISAYSETASLKGIDIGGAAGVPVVASAAGRVVYAGSGLRGYGKLVIVKHNKTYLSAYAHLDQISIREGQNVSRGQELGKMGNTDADQVKLHFEIRALGKPVDPLRYLPRG
jgi:lipoprotein NlpD